MLTKEMLDEIIIERYSRGQSLKLRDVSVNFMSEYSYHEILDSATEYYGGWKLALKANGVSNGVYISSRMSKQEVTEELRRLQAEGHSMRTQDFDRELFRGIQQHFGGYKNAKKELGIFVDRMPYVKSDNKKRADQAKVLWTDDVIERELRSLMATGIGRGEMRKKNSKLLSAISRRFGSLDACAEHFGIVLPEKAYKRKYDKITLDQFVIESHKKGQNSYELKTNSGKEERRLCDAACKYYGNWNNALLANGLEPSTVIRTFTNKEEVVAAFVNDLASGKKRHEITYTRAVKKFFGSLEELEKYLGIFKEPESKPVFNVYSKETVNQKVFSIYEKEQDRINGKVLDAADKNILHSIKYHFGNIIDYFSSLDIDYYKRPYVPFRWDEENVKRQLLRWIREGNPVNYTYIAYKHKGILDAARKFYGSWEALFEACGLAYDDFRTDTALASFYGFKLEDVFEDILNELKINHVRQPEINGCHPDFVNGDTWYDVKLSEWTISHADCVTVKKYEPHCRNLMIVFLRGDETTDKMITEKTRLVNIRHFIEMLPQGSQKKYNERLTEIISQVASNEIGSQTKDIKTA